MLASSQTIAFDWSEAHRSSVPLGMNCPAEMGEIDPAVHVSPLYRAVAQRLLGERDPQQLAAKLSAGQSDQPLADFLCINSDQAASPKDVFSRLRWGGVCMFASDYRREVVEAAERFKRHGFSIEGGPLSVRKGLPLPFLSKKMHGFAARKTELLAPGETTTRFTYDVHLTSHNDVNEPVVVEKRVPSVEALVERLKKKHPDYSAEGIEKLANKFVNRIFPTFLTREAGMLKILQEHLPAPYNKRVPRLISMEKDERGFVRQLKMNWLRNGGEALSQIEFARQSADLLRVLHDAAKVVHLDLRLDNFVITPDGVGFVDFGSAIRDGEDLSRNPLLQSLFGELMRTSQIQRLMEKMTTSGQVTSHAICSGSGKPDKAADFFYLALQFNAPLSNPDLTGLIQYDPGSKDASNLSALTSQILRPKDPTQPLFRSAKDILHGIERIQRGLDWRG